MITGIKPSWKQGFARSAAESAHPNLRGASLQGLWSFALGPTGSMARDVSGRNRHGTLNSNMNPATSWIAGNPRAGGWAVQGTTDVAPNNHIVTNAYDFTGDFTSEGSIVIWLRMRDYVAPGNSFIELDSTAGGTKSHYGHSASELLYITTFGTSRIINGVANTQFDRTQWHALAITTKPGAGNYTLYQNGIVAATGTGPASVSVDSGLTILGEGGASSTAAMDGDIASVALYNRCLSAGEVQVFNDQNALLRVRRRLHVSSSVTKLYSRAQSAALVTDDTDLGTAYSASDYTDVDTDNGVRVGQVASDTNFAVHLFKDFVGSQTSATLTCNVQSDLAPSSRSVFLQIYNYNSTTWETKDTDNAAAADTDFDLTANIADLTNYKSAEFIACRVYQANA